MSELNREILQQLGYKSEQRKIRRNYGYEYERWFLIMPDGRDMPSPRSLEGSNLPFGWGTEYDAWSSSPMDFEHSLDAVASVVPYEYGLYVWAALIENQFTALIYLAHINASGSMYADPKAKYTANGTTRQEAAAKAFLEYLKWKSQQRIAIQSEV